MLKKLDNLGIEYCCCGGLSVLLHAYCNTNMYEFRATTDLDLFLSEDFIDIDITKLYLSVYSPDSEISEKMIDNVMGEGVYKELLNSYNDINLVLESTAKYKTPKIDALRFLNGYTLDSIPKEKLNYKGYNITVATKEAF